MVREVRFWRISMANVNLDPKYDKMDDILRHMYITTVSTEVTQKTVGIQASLCSNGKSYRLGLYGARVEY